MIVIVDYGMGNLMSILNMLRKLGVEAIVSSNIEDIKHADKLILPGVGAFDNAMLNLHNLGLVKVLNKKVFEENTPILGICLGMQLFAKKSEEGHLQGMCWLDADVVRFNFQHDQKHLKVPHMRWNTVNTKKTNSFFNDMFDESRFYFIHSYHMICHDQENILTTTVHGYEFVSSVKRNNIIGVQFHPEKSHKFGLKLLENFAKSTNNA